MLAEKAWLSLFALIHPKGVLKVEVRTHPCLHGPCFVHWWTVMLEEEGASSKLFPKSWGHGFVQNVLVH